MPVDSSAPKGPIRSIDGIVVTPKLSEQAPKKRARHMLKFRMRVTKRQLVVLTVICVVAIIGGLTCWRLFIWQPAAISPFTTANSSSVSFPLYYPTSLPQGFRIDTKSVASPENGVIVFSLIGPKNTKLYISEEARSSTFNLGGFYNTFQGLKEIGVSDGAIAVGHINAGQTEVASRANNQTWILATTSAKVPLAELQNMLKSLAHA